MKSKNTTYTNDFIKKLIEENNAFFIQTRHHLHQYPELSGKEVETSKYIKDFLDSWNIDYENAGDNSIVATIKGKKENLENQKTIALRGDIDALPIIEETGLDWASKNPGVMHACGHDVHGTFMLGAAKILNELKDDFSGQVKIIFQESEENGAGAKKVLDSNLLNDVDTIIALHDSQELDLGTFALGYETMSAFGAGAHFVIETSGKKNAITVAGELVSLITTLAEENFSKYEQIVMVPTLIQTEKIKDNIPSKISVYYNSRTLNFSNEEIMQKVLLQAAKKTEDLFDCKIEAILRRPGKVVNNNKHFTDLAVDVIKKYFGKESVHFTRPVMSGEDFAHYQEKIPGTYIHIGGAVNNDYQILHTSKTCVDDKILSIGIEFLIRYVFEFLNISDIKGK